MIRLSWNQFRCLVQFNVHKRITVSSEQGQGKNKQMFVIIIIITVIEIRTYAFLHRPIFGLVVLYTNH